MRAMFVCDIMVYIYIYILMCILLGSFIFDFIKSCELNSCLWSDSRDSSHPIADVYLCVRIWLNLFFGFLPVCIFLSVWILSV